METREDLGTVAVEATLAVLGGKWKLLILWHLREEPKRYGELRRLVGNITEKMLIQQLRELEQQGVVTRTAYPEVPPRVEYAFSDYGRSLVPVLAVLCQWGETHLARQSEFEQAPSLARADKDKF